MEEFIMAEMKKAATRTRKKATAIKATYAEPVTTKAEGFSMPTPVSPIPLTITQQEREYRIQQAAYFRAEKRGFQGDPREDWSAAEAEIDADLVKKNIRVI
jgi:hypothetical protein